MGDDPEPKWRSDFPIAWGADHYVTRREFTKYIVLISGATVVGNGAFVVWRRRESTRRFAPIEIAHAGELSFGGVKLFKFPTETGDDPAILIRLHNGEYAAYKQRCTHLSCPVLYEASSNRLVCPCHNGAFDAATGKVLEGPPPRPLPQIALRVENGCVYAEGVVGS